MRQFQLTYILLFLLPMLQAQSDYQKQMEELNLRILLLEKENSGMKANIRLQDSLEYCSFRYEIFNTFSHIPKLDFDFKNTTEKIAVTGLFTKLMQANNPTSDILGFQFAEIVFISSEKYFKESLKTESEKKRFSQIVTKIVNNPVVSSLAQTNLVTSVVSAIISMIASFSSSNVNIEKDGNRIKNIEVEHKDVFDQKSISAFRNELQVYINFYDALIISSNKYLNGLENLNVKYSNLIKSVRDYKNQIYSGLDLKESNLLIQLASLLPDPEKGPVIFRDYLNDQKLMLSLGQARQYPLLEQSVDDFKKEYNTLLFQFLTEYMNTLQTARDFPKGIMDKAKTDKLLSDIKEFIGSLKNDEDDLPDAFCEN